VTEVDATVALLMGRITVLEELVRWLSLPYGDGEPVFAGAVALPVGDGRGNMLGYSVYGTPDGQQSAQAAVMHTLWHQVVGREHVDPVADRVMIQCEACGLWHGEVR